MSSTKRFGSRYGAKVKKRVAKIEIRQRQKHKCPFCSRFAVKRISTAIFQCNKCNRKFTGQAYWP